MFFHAWSDLVSRPSAQFTSRSAARLRPSCAPRCDARNSPPVRPRPWCAAPGTAAASTSGCASTQARHWSSVRPVFSSASANSFLALFLASPSAICTRLCALISPSPEVSIGQVDHVLVVATRPPTARRRTASRACSRRASATAPCAPGPCSSSRCSWRLRGGLRRRRRASCRRDGRGAAVRTDRPGDARCRRARRRSCDTRS